MHEGHPRIETEQQRQYAHRRMHESAQQKLRRYGEDSPASSPVLRIKDVALRFKDNTPCHLLSFQGEIMGARVNQLRINVYKTEDRTGPMTVYVSHNSEPFTRVDMNPQETSPISEQELAAGSKHAVEGVVQAVVNKQVDIEEGVDGLPITAQEAQQVGLQIRTASVDRSKM